MSPKRSSLITRLGFTEAAVRDHPDLSGRPYGARNQRYKEFDYLLKHSAGERCCAV